ncbi:MAG: NADH-quinone oxidoreductase subunit L [Spirochaetota bacterium]|nr:NADH-quinone oxidoreductase subunit L [Spirochaetota bacterium]
MADLIFIIPLAPLIGFIINGLIGKKLGENIVGFIGCFSIFISFIISILALWKVASTGEAINFSAGLGSWISSGGVEVSIGFKIDQLSAVMINIVSGIGFLIHVYSIGYMKGDEGVYKFFAYLNLFCFAMLILVMGDNILLLFLGWEGVGLCSYLLIGFWYKREDYADAGKKAFIVNRVGDFGFLLGIFLIIIYMGTLDFAGMQGWIDKHPSEVKNLVGSGVITIITLLLFVGATGKSAQIPLYTWLPDAMAGPTPVSALIHAATMVTAGVYMIGRLHFLFSLSDTTMFIILIVGAATALYSGTIGITQKDIKKVLAYSTVSQLGYMFMAMAVGAFSVGIFHLMTHAFFKALLFLSAGSVIIATHHEQDMDKMGGLSKRLPITYRAMFIGCLALSGVVPFISGFLSKDLILEKVFFGSLPAGKLFWIVGVMAAIFTAFYSFRLMGMTFWGKTKMSHEDYHHVKEPHKAMTGVLIVLAVLSLFGGLIGIPEILGGANNFHHFLTGKNKVFTEMVGETHHGALPYILMIISTSLGILFAFMAARLYSKDSSLPDKFSEKGVGKLLYTLSYNKYYVDEIYDIIFVRTIVNGSRILWKYIDVYIIDGAVNGIAYLFKRVGNLGRNLQTGNVNSYALSFIIGTIGVISFLIYYLIKSS